MPPATTPNPGPYDLGPFQEMVGIQWGEPAVDEGEFEITIADSFLSSTDVLDTCGGGTVQLSNVYLTQFNYIGPKTWPLNSKGIMQSVSSAREWDFSFACPEQGFLYGEGPAGSWSAVSVSLVWRMLTPAPQLWTVGDKAKFKYLTQVSSISSSPGASRLWSPPCNTADTTVGNVGYRQYVFLDFNNTGIAELLSRTWEGRTSGAIWSPPSQNMAFICVSGNERWGGTNFNAVAGGRVYQHYVETAGGGAQYTYYINDGEFPGTPLPAFIASEDVLVGH